MQTAVHQPTNRPAIAPQPVRFVRLPEVLHLTGISRSTLYDLIKRGDFPASVSLGGKSVAWLSSELETWMAARVAARQA